jgi:hypothetical protein
MLAPYRVGTTDVFRFAYRGGYKGFWFASALTVMIAVGLVMSAGLGAFEWIALGTAALGTAAFASYTIPNQCWFEIEQRPSEWVFRSRHGLWMFERRLPSDGIAIAAVSEQANEYGVAHNIQIVRAPPNGPFARDLGKPIILAVTGWPTSVMVAICRLITPGYSPETYLLSTNLPRRASRR